MSYLFIEANKYNTIQKFMTKITVRPVRFVKALDVKHVTKVAVR